MYTAKGTQAYAQIGVESAVMSASQQQLVTMLFDGVLSALVRARLLCRTTISKAKASLCQKQSTSLRNGLRVSLDEEQRQINPKLILLIAIWSGACCKPIYATMLRSRKCGTLMRNIANTWKKSFSPLL
ncbi:flagellar export chaperone FliS [Shigella flexneri]